MTAESGGRVDSRWRMRDLWVTREWRVAVEMKTGVAAVAGGLTRTRLVAAAISGRLSKVRLQENRRKNAGLILVELEYKVSADPIQHKD